MTIAPLREVSRALPREATLAAVGGSQAPPRPCELPIHRRRLSRVPPSAKSANAKAATALTPIQAYAPYIAVALVAVAAVALTLFLWGRGGKKGAEAYVKETHEVDLGRIAWEGRLREDDFRLLEFLAERGAGPSGRL